LNKPSWKWGIQLSLRMLTVFPSPMPHRTPSTRRSLPWRVLLHIYDDDLGLGACQKSVSGKYLPLRTLAHKDPGSVSKCYPCLASITWLKRMRYRPCIYYNKLCLALVMEGRGRRRAFGSC
jgi:hypothetical protein